MGVFLCATPPASAHDAKNYANDTQDYFVHRADHTVIKPLLSADQRAYYRDLFAAIHQRDWTKVQAQLVALPDGPLHPLARAEFFLAPHSPKIATDTLMQWLATGADLPEAKRIESLALKDGATTLPQLPKPRDMLTLTAASRRTSPHDILDGTMPAMLANDLRAHIKADDPQGARDILAAADARLSDGVRAEWRQRVAWSYFIENDNADSYVMAESAAGGGMLPGGRLAPLASTTLPHPAVVPGTTTQASQVQHLGQKTITSPEISDASSRQASVSQPSGNDTLLQDPGTVSGPWVAEGWWTAGLAAWRMDQWEKAGQAFAAAARTARNGELSAGALYWQARAEIRSNHPERASALLRRAADFSDTMYGMMAVERLGIRQEALRETTDLTAHDWQRLCTIGNVRVAVALVEIGEDTLADEVLRHQARIGDPALFQPLSRLARALALPSSQLWMAYHVPAGASTAPAGRYPVPHWIPSDGWLVDPALVLADTLQESRFRARVVSHAGARGLMQIMPAAARQHASDLGISGQAADLDQPAINLAIGQLHLLSLRDAPSTGGLLPKVIAAYNAGLQPIRRWNSQIHDGADPLLWMESVPYWETRSYVTTVIRNYWMYENQAGGHSGSRIALVEGLWPTLPGLDGSKAVRIAAGSPKPSRPAATILAVNESPLHGY